MGKIPVKMRAVVYSLSPFQQKVMPGLWKDLPNKLTKKVSENWISATLLITPLVGVYSYARHNAPAGLLYRRSPEKLLVYVQAFQEAEKLEHRY